MKHPMQPINVDKNGVARFRQNKLVTFLATGRLNEVSTMNFSEDDRMQVAQLIGYSVNEYGMLGYVTDDSYDAACAQLESSQHCLLAPGIIGDEL